MSARGACITIALVVTLTSCECSLSPELDAGVDAGSDAGQQPCGPEHPTVACVEGGPFELAKYWWYGVQQLPPPIDPSPVAVTRLPTFWIDRTEVTVEAYADAVSTGIVPPPPDECGVRFVAGVDPDLGVYSSVSEVSGWAAGAPDPGRPRAPVVCVTREEAQRYCEAAGGRLPRAGELMKAARGADPGPRRFPWGDSPPAVGENRALQLLQEPYGWWFDVAAIGIWRGEPEPALGTMDVSASPGGASPYGVLGLSGNVTEHVFDCAVDIGAVYGGLSEDPLNYPTTAWRAECPPNSEQDEAYLLAGSNWASGPYTEGLSMSVGRRLPLPLSIDRLRAGVAAAVAIHDLRSHEAFWGVGEMPEDFDDIPAERDRRSWFVGFRCAYDAPPP